MGNYTQVKDFSAKDSLTSSDPDKVIKGSDLDAELDAIATAISSKYDSSDLATEAEAQAGTNNTKLMTPLRVSDAISALGEATTIVKTGNQTKESDTALADDSVLAGWSLNADTRYYVTGILRLGIKAASDIKLKLDFSSAPTYAFITYGLGFEAGATAAGDHQADESDVAILTTDTNGIGLAIVAGSIKTGATAPTVDLQWAQNSSDAASTIMYQGSFLTFAKLD